MTVELWTLSLGETALIGFDKPTSDARHYKEGLDRYVRITVVGVKSPFGRDSRVIAVSSVNDTPTHARLIASIKLVSNIDVSNPKAAFGFVDEWEFIDVRPYYALIHASYNWIVGRKLIEPYFIASEIQAGDTICTTLDNKLLRIEVSSVSECEGDPGEALIELYGIVHPSLGFEDTSKPLKLKRNSAVLVINRKYPALWVREKSKHKKPSRLLLRKPERDQ